MELRYPRVNKLLEGKKLIVSDEKQLQAQIMVLFEAERESSYHYNDKSFPHVFKEHKFGTYGQRNAGTVDFFLEGGTAIEVKIKGSAMAIHRQLKRYAEHPEVNEIILITSKTMSLPAAINGKPANIINISKACL